MLYKESMSEPPPLFVQLDKLEKNENDECFYWKEKARWIRFEEQAEDALGRWSKPYVATIPQSALDELKHLFINGKLCLNVNASDIKEIADVLANELLDYFNDLENARVFAEIVCLPHHHHHEKRMRKTASGNNLMRMVSSGNFSEFKSQNIIEEVPELNVLNETNQTNPMRRRLSFVDNVTLEESIAPDFKENTKFKKKVHRKAEGASILVMPFNFTKYVPKTELVFLRLEAATELQGLLEVRLRSRFIALIIGPSERHAHLYEIGRALAACLADDLCRELFYAAKCKDDCIQTIDNFNRCTLVIPPSEWNPKIRIEPPEKYLSKEERKNVEEISEFIHGDESQGSNHEHVDPTLKGSRRPFRGIVSDVKRKLPFFMSDFTDALNLQCIASTLYIYLVSLCSLVAFGGMLGKKTDNLMGTMECILAGSLCGVAFSLFSGQPLNIISATGPMLILESIIKNLCDKNEVNYMEFRLWIGLWTCFFIIILVAFNLSFLVKYITRFTEDSFATLVAVIFIIDAIKNLLHLNDLPDRLKPNLNDTNQNTSINIEYEIADHEKTFFFSILLFLLTFFVCITLKKFRNKPYLPSKIRQIFSDFAVMIAIVLASLLDKYMGTNTQKLTIPQKLQPTTPRGWIIPLFDKNPFYTIFLAIVPAIIATILVFMDQQITAVIVNRKEFKLKKSSGYHLDLFIIGITIGLCSILGFPWFVAATVLALTHVDSLKLMSENTAPGERPKFMGVREQRATTLIMSVLIGLSVFLNQILSNIPMAVLYGVFMFMGVSALNGMQFFQRLLIIFMPSKHQPDLPYLRHVSLKRVHLFTFIQLLSLCGLYFIKNIESVAITFPILVLATGLIRKLLDFVFTQRELFWLDDLLPGSKKDQDHSHNSEKQKLTGGKVDLSADSFFKNMSEKSIPSKPSSKLFEKDTKDLSSSTNSNLDSEHDQYEPNINFRSNDSLDENNNTHMNTHKNHHLPPVKFVTHFSDIKEDED